MKKWIVATVVALMVMGAAIVHAQREINLDLNDRTFKLTVINDAEGALKCGQESGMGALVLAVALSSEGTPVASTEETAYCLTERAK